MNLTAEHIIFKGAVQGVGFRYTAQKIADRHPVTGFVRNLSDGTVEMFIQGPVQDVKGCLADIDKTFSGYIRDIQVTQTDYDPEYSDFTIKF